ncbi:hypothetical protein SUGI_1167370 [Cryptomeria japonica]|nr:hypothetical protein SUGI_1167370 [Cryptomeria japonica]
MYRSSMCGYVPVANPLDPSYFAQKPCPLPIISSMDAKQNSLVMNGGSMSDWRRPRVGSLNGESVVGGSFSLGSLGSSVYYVGAKVGNHLMKVAVHSGVPTGSRGAKIDQGFSSSVAWPTSNIDTAHLVALLAKDGGGAGRGRLT